MTVLRFLLLPETIAALGRTVERRTTPGQSLAEFLRSAVEDRPGVLRELFDETGRPRPELMALANGKPATWETPVAESDELDVFQIVDGG